MYTLPTATAAAAGLLAFATSASAHGFIKEWTANGVTQKAQKQSLSSTAFRSAPDNTGWIGSNFLTSPAITCGASNTPFGTVAQPSGKVFSGADQAAGKTLAVKAGSDVELVVAGNPGTGWPHKNGHVQTYLASCGTSSTACQNFDASKGQWFKIQEEKDGIQNKLVPAFDSGVDGNRWKVPIPQNVADGSYMMRFELIAFGQSNGAEGKQDQYYPFCGQIAISGGSGASSKLSTVTFPGAYKNGNIDQSSLPGPAVLASGSTASGSSGSTSSDSGSTGSVNNTLSSGSGTTDSGNGSTSSTSDSTNSSDGSQDSGKGTAPSESSSTDSGDSSTPSGSGSGHSGSGSGHTKSCKSGRRRRSQSSRARRHAGGAHGKRVSAKSFAHGHS